MSEEKFVYQIHKDVEIEGLKELRITIAAWNRYWAQRRAFEEGDIHTMPKKPEVNIGELKDQYPRAAAYLTAERWRLSSKFKKSAFGKQAMDRILAGEDHNKVLDDMYKAWAAFRVAQEG